MKTIKIFCLPSHASKTRTSGVDFARIVQPMKALDGFELGNVKFVTRIYDPVADDGADWRKIVPEYDLIYFNYTTNPLAFAHMGLAVRQANKKMIMDVDDALWNVMPDNPSYEHYKKGAEPIRNFTSICNEVDGITTTNRYLKNVIAHETRKTHDLISIFDNQIDLGLYSHRSRQNNSNIIKLVHFGSTTHFIDLQNEEFEKGIDMIMREYPNVVIKTVGAMIPKYRHKWGLRYENSYGDVDLYKWVKERFPIFMDEADICVVPLEDNVYTRSKSAIKFLEMSSAVKPGVWQDIRQYQEVVKNGETGFLAKTAQEWHDCIKKLIDDTELRNKIGNAAFKYVSDYRQMKDHVEEYALYFKQLIDKA